MSPVMFIIRLIFIFPVAALPASTSASGTGGYLLKCRDGWKTHSGACYRFFETRYKWNVANNVCSGLLSSLLTIQSEEERQWIASQIDKPLAIENTWWVGLHGLDQSYKWIHKTLPTYDYSLPFAKEPDDANGSKECAMISNRGFFHVEVCSKGEKFICKAKKKSATDKCDTVGYAGKMLADDTYCHWYNFFGMRQWDYAKDFCRTIKLVNTTEGVTVALLSIENEAELSKIKKDLESMKIIGGSWWTGLKYQKGDQMYTFTDGTTYSKKVVPWLTKYLTGIGEDLCGVILSNGKVTSYSCDNGLPFVCKHSRVVCPAYWKEAGDSCYFSSQERHITWTDAQSSCHEMNSHLLEIDSQQEKIWLQQTNILLIGANYWTGLNAIEKSGVYVWEHGSKLNNSLITWNKGVLEFRHCTELVTDIGGLEYRECHVLSTNLACEYAKKSGQTSCALGWLSYLQKCYYFSNELENAFDWSNNKLECQAVYKSSLNPNKTISDDVKVNYVTIANDDELNFVLSTLKSRKIKDIWLGLRCKDGGLSWGWEGAPGVPSTTVPDYYSSKQPNRQFKCTIVINGGIMSTVKCNSNHSYVCEMEKSLLDMKKPLMPSKSSAILPWSICTLSLLAIVGK